MLTLLVMQGPDKGRRFELPDAPLLIGRESRQLPLTDNTVSRRHAELYPRGGEWILKDMGSSNGSYVNGVRVSNTHSLKLGDQVRVGKTILVFGGAAGVSRGSGAIVSLSGEEVGMESSIMHSVQSNDDSMVLAVPEPAVAAMSNLKLLYSLGAALGSSFTVQQVLEVVMDLVFEHVKADRGMILLIDDKTEMLVPKVVRVRHEEVRERRPAPGIDSDNGDNERIPVVRADELELLPQGATGAPAQGESHNSPGRGTAHNDHEETESRVEAERFHASRTIINHVLKSGEGVLSSNAMTDQRFSKGKSVHNMGIRSALCVPIKMRRLDRVGTVKPASSASSTTPVVSPPSDEVVGAIYIDSSVKNYTYSPDQLRLLSAIGLQAGMAIQNAKLYQQGLAAERLAAIGETTAALSHSIKNILQALRGGADVVEMGLKSNNVTQSHKGWRIVDRNLEKIYNLTMNLLAYSRPREPRLELINPKVLIEECLELVAPTANEKGVMAVADVDKDHPAVPLDPDGLHQIIMNLLSNALDAVEPHHGLIRVVCHYDSDHKQTVIEVIDNGIGIPPAMMKHLFELFHSTKGNRGTGIGLAVTKKIVEEHEGSISVKSTPGAGTTFTVKLPIYHESLKDPSHTHGPAR